MKTFLISDLHLGHNNVWKFADKNGKRYRDWAENAEEGDEVMKDRWNSVVSPKDKVYILGDLAIARKAIPKIAAFNGTKILIKGNHDLFDIKDYLPYFKDIRGTHKLDKFILSHYPIHRKSIPGWAKANIHGHIHHGRVMYKKFFFLDRVDEKYYNVSIENLNGFPIDFEELRRIYQ